MDAQRKTGLTIDNVLLARRMLSSGQLPTEISEPHIDVLADAFKQTNNLELWKAASDALTNGLESNKNVSWQDCAMTALVKILRGSDAEVKGRAMPLIDAARSGMKFHAERARTNREIITGLLR